MIHVTFCPYSILPGNLILPLLDYFCKCCTTLILREPYIHKHICIHYRIASSYEGKHAVF